MPTSKRPTSAKPKMRVSLAHWLAGSSSFSLTSRYLSKYLIIMLMVIALMIMAIISSFLLLHWFLFLWHFFYGQNVAPQIFPFRAPLWFLRCIAFDWPLWLVVEFFCGFLKFIFFSFQRHHISSSSGRATITIKTVKRPTQLMNTRPTSQTNRESK